jgi:glutaredoxin
MKRWIVAAVIAAMPALAELYSWIDANGVHHYSNDPPPAGEPVTELTVIKEGRIEYEAPPAAADTSGKKSSKAAVQKNVVIYTDPRSQSCADALEFFNQNNVPVTQYDISASEENRKRFKSVNGEGVPLIFIGDERINGWSEDRVRGVLGIGTEPVGTEVPTEKTPDVSIPKVTVQ